MANFIPFTTRINVLFEGRAVAQESLETPMFLAHHDLFTQRARIFSSTQEILDAGFPTGHPAVRYAEAMFSGQLSASTLVIGRRAPSVYTVQVAATGWVTDDIVSVNASIASVKSTFSYTVQANDTVQDVGDGLAALLQADAGITTATSDANGLITITPAASTIVAFGAALFTTIYTTSSETVQDALAAVTQENNNFFFLSAESHVIADQSALAGYAEQNDMLYLYSTQDTDVLNAVNTTNVFHILSGLQYQFTCGVYNEKADIDFPEGAIVGSMAAQDPSFAFTANLQTLKGITPSNLTDGEKTAIVTKNGNYYELERGVGTFKEGFTANGDFIDRSRFGLWLKLRGQLALFNRMKRAADRGSAITYTDAGVAQLRAALFNDVINQGLANGAIASGITTDPVSGNTINLNPIVETGTRAQQTNNNIGQRLWTGFIIDVVYSGAIHHVDATAYVVNNRDPDIAG